ncbi:acetylxylan esterase [Rubritalea halochordaticola]|uniref:Acetylxylan esterase n=1 Tax=Rubritalea halochordaticola TaxID=714537 RepID=A0ABP9UWS3_9BACT
MFRVLPVLLLFLFSSFLPVLAKQKPDENITYKEVEGKDLQLHVFYPEGHQKNDARPAIVFFFGGGWKSGAAQQFYPHCEYLASRGMVAISADYRTAKSHKTSPQECVMDGKSAIRYVCSHAKELGIDPNKVLAGGGSAGGHVAAATATLKKYDDPADNLKVSCRPAALVLFNPVYDNSKEGYGYDRVKDYWKDFSPMHNLSKEVPPTIVFLGDKDKLIPVSTAQSFQKQMKELGVKSELHVYPGQEHGFFNANKSGGKYFKLNCVEMDRFLVELGYLKEKPSKN